MKAGRPPGWSSVWLSEAPLAVVIHLPDEIPPADDPTAGADAGPNDPIYRRSRLAGERCCSGTAMVNDTSGSPASRLLQIRSTHRVSGMFIFRGVHCVVGMFRFRGVHWAGGICRFVVSIQFAGIVGCTMVARLTALNAADIAAGCSARSGARPARARQDWHYCR